MKEREYLIKLFEEYNSLLTELQRKYFILYYYEDLSLNEIGENNNVSKAYLSKILNNVEKKLNHYESNMNAVSKKNQIKKVISNIDDNIKQKIIEIID